MEVMRFTGEDFYKHFFCGFQEYVKKNEAKYNRTKSDAAWTEFVKDGFLGELAKKLGFKEAKEGIYGVDITWEKPSEGILITIEHENDIKSVWKREIPNLLKTAAPLKVLITYVDDAEFPGESIANKLLAYLKEANFNQEFLLILGSTSMNEPTDWVGHYYRPELTCRSLILCSNKLQAESSPARKAWKTRKQTQS
ncbi:MAG: hypothetical protein QXH91_07025 [Candidatus Bathyarchaeia archaeon]